MADVKVPAATSLSTELGRETAAHHYSTIGYFPHRDARDINNNKT